MNKAIKILPATEIGNGVKIDFIYIYTHIYILYIYVYIYIWRR